MSLTPQEKQWDLEVQRRKKKVVEEELQRKTDLTYIQSLIIFSDIFRVLRQAPKHEDKTKKPHKLKRSRYFLGRRLLEEEVDEKVLEDTPKKQTYKDHEMVHLSAKHRVATPKPSKEELETYRKYLKS